MNPEFDAAAQHLASELTTSPQAAASELRNDLYGAEQSRQPQAIANVEALANRANEFAGPCAEHLAITRAPQAYGGYAGQFGGYGGQQQYRQQLEVTLVQPRCGQGYAPGYAPPSPGYNPYGGQYYNQVPPAYGGPGITLGVPGLGITIRPGGHHHW